MQGRSAAISRPGSPLWARASRVVARGEHLKAIRARGLKLKEGGEEIVARVEATDRIAEVGRPELVVLGVKAHQLAPIAADVASILTPETMVLTTQNGIPWWYFFKHGGPYEGHRLESVDPGGVIAGHLPVDAVIAGISYQAAEIESPGVIRHVEGHRLPLAEIDGSKSARVAALAELFSRAGFKSPVLSDVRTEIWTKLWGNLTFNPLSALARATLEDICRFPPTRALAAAMMGEAQTVGEAFGIRFRLPDRQAHRRRRGHRAPQDLDAAGHRARPGDRDRRAARLGHRARPPRQCPDAASRRCLCGDETSGRDGLGAPARLAGTGRRGPRGLQNFERSGGYVV